MNKILTVFILFFTITSYGQVGIGTNSPASTAKLEVNSTTQGFLPPRMTYNQLKAITSPAEGLMIYCSDCLPKGLYVYDGTNWSLSSGGVSPSSPSTGGTGVVSVYNCSTSSAGTMSQGTPVSGVTQTITATVTTVGTYSISSTANGVTFAASGTFAGTGSQNIVLTATGTPTAAVSSDFTLNTTPNCNFSRTSAPQNFTIGQAVLGGKVGYILQSGDNGYDPNIQHGLIVSTTDQSTGAQWGCIGTVITAIPQGTNIQTAGSSVGRGNQNTIDIMAECATSGIAARICGDLVLGGYSDWYLPSYYEFYQIFQNNATWGGFSNAYYWTSTQDSNEIYPSYAKDEANRAVATGGGYMGGGYGPTDKSDSYYVRAIRSF